VRTLLAQLELARVAALERVELDRARARVERVVLGLDHNVAEDVAVFEVGDGEVLVHLVRAAALADARGLAAQLRHHLLLDALVHVRLPRLVQRLALVAFLLFVQVEEGVEVAHKAHLLADEVVVEAVEGVRIARARVGGGAEPDSAGARAERARGGPAGAQRRVRGAARRARMRARTRTRGGERRAGERRPRALRRVVPCASYRRRVGRRQHRRQQRRQGRHAWIGYGAPRGNVPFW
jgi:hypothetical protein